MDSHIYTILGTLAGVLITQFMNYLLEARKSKDRLREIELENNNKISEQILREKKEVYARYLAALDLYAVSGREDHEKVVKPYYEAAIISSEVTANIIFQSYEAIIPDAFDIAEFKKVKGILLKAFHQELIKNA
jgi:hypothetical protein